ncbi:MAG: helix-turn-helix domain-containing protein [Clostridium sp.]|nr:helix-turn-helix domain-containing protein [Clostridium sp.]
MTLGDKISKLRKENNMTEVHLADELGVTNKAISKWENGV